MKPLEFEGYLNELTDIVEDFADIYVRELNIYDELLLNDYNLLKIVKITPRKKYSKKSIIIFSLNNISTRA